jgi:hypothetical protein
MHLTTICVNLHGGPTVSIRTPRSLGVDRREDGAERGLEIEAKGDEFVRIVFRATAQSEELERSPRRRWSRKTRSGSLLDEPPSEHSRSPAEERHVSE